MRESIPTFMSAVPGIWIALPSGEPSGASGCTCGPRWPVAFEYQATIVALESLAIPVS